MEQNTTAIVTAITMLSCLLVAGIFFVLSLNKTLRLMPKESHVFPKWFSWLLLVPLVNLVFCWMMLPFGVPKTIQTNAKNDTLKKESTHLFGIGLTLSITNSLLIFLIDVRALGAIIMFASLVLWIIYWEKVVSVRRYLDANYSARVINKADLPMALRLVTYILVIMLLTRIGFLIYLNFFAHLIYPMPMAVTAFDIASYIFLAIVFTFIIIGIRKSWRTMYVISFIFFGLLLIKDLIETTTLTNFEINHNVFSLEQIILFAIGIILNLIIVTLISTKKSRAWFQK